MTDAELERLADLVADRLEERLRRQHLHHLPDHALLTAKEGQALLGISRWTWRRLRNEAELPPAVATIAGERWRKGALLAAPQERKRRAKMKGR